MTKEIEARKEGATAFAEGKGHEDNPYSEVTQFDQWCNWFDGWFDAKQKVDKKKAQAGNWGA